ncbi:MAG: hypothetical protein PHW93_05210 [Candidatus Methanomethylophilaceae archaeon]|nr:hypothetical protein [Candidatus Methanomethylophilaceae archaeon]
MSARKAIAIVALLMMLSFSAVLSSASSSYTIETYVNAGSAHGEGFTLSAGATFGWELWIYSIGDVSLMIMDDANYQLFRAGQPFSCLEGPTTVNLTNPSLGYLTVAEEGKYWLVVEAYGPGPAEVHITLIDVPFFSTDFGMIVLLVLQFIGAVVLVIFIIIALLVLRGRLKRQRDERNASVEMDDYDLQPSNRAGEQTERSDASRMEDDPYRTIDPFHDDPYIRSKPLWRKRK